MGKAGEGGGWGGGGGGGRENIIFLTIWRWQMLCTSLYFYFHDKIKWTRPELEPTIYHTWGEHANHYTTGAVN